MGFLPSEFREPFENRGAGCRGYVGVETVGVREDGAHQKNMEH